MHNDWGIAFHGTIHKTKHTEFKKDLDPCNLFMQLQMYLSTNKSTDTYMFYFDCLQTYNFQWGIEVDVNYVSLFFILITFFVKKNLNLS